MYQSASRPAQSAAATTELDTHVNYFTGLRHVHPYTFTHRVNAKGRWLGKPLLTALQAEFSGHTEQAWQEAMREGRLFLERRPNSRKKRRRADTNSTAEDAVQPDGPERIDFDLSTVVTPSMVLVNTQLRRCEPPIPAHNIYVQHADNGVLVINKPVGVQVHPAGGARLNTLVHIVQAEQVLQAPPKLLYRIDRVTSGLLLAATSSEGAQAASARLSDPACTKVYLVRVSGNVASTAAAVAANAPEHVPTAAADTPCVTLPVAARQPSAPDASGSEQAGAVGSGAGGAASGVAQPRYRADDYVDTPGWSPGDPQQGTDWYRGVPRPSTATLQALVAPSPAAVHSLHTEDWSGRSWGACGARSTCGIAVRASIAQVNPRIGLHTVHAQGKQALTELLPLWYDQASDSTVLQAVPRTGRTHQIRLHCQWLGHPVLGDEGYGWHAQAVPEAQRALHPDGGVCLHAFVYRGEGWRYAVPPAPWALPVADPGASAASSEQAGSKVGATG